MEKYSETEKNQKDARVKYINQRWSQLYDLEKGAGDQAVKYLLLTNAGGAIATLSFLGASKVAIDIIGIKIALVLFIVGILFVGAWLGKQFHHMSIVSKAWAKDVGEYYQDEVDYNTIIKNDEAIAVGDTWDIAIPYLSLACFVAGCIAGLVSLF